MLRGKHSVTPCCQMTWGEKVGTSLASIFTSEAFPTRTSSGTLLSAGCSILFDTKLSSFLFQKQSLSAFVANPVQGQQLVHFSFTLGACHCVFSCQCLLRQPDLHASANEGTNFLWSENKGTCDAFFTQCMHTSQTPHSEICPLINECLLFCISQLLRG